MQNKVKALWENQKRLAELKESKEELLYEWRVEHQDLLSDIDEVQEEVNRLDAEVRELRLDEWDGEDKSKKFGVGIREVTRLEYDEGAALDWAVKHELCLRLDKRGFESIAKQGEIDFVIIRKIPEATVAKDLGGYLES